MKRSEKVKIEGEKQEEIKNKKMEEAISELRNWKAIIKYQKC